MKWNGRDYRPVVPQKIKFKEEFNAEEYIQSLAEKSHKVPVWRAIPNPIGVNTSVETGPQPTPSITPSNTPTNTATPSPTPEPSVSPTNTMTPTPSVTAEPTVTPTNTMTPTPSASSVASGTTEAYTFLEAAAILSLIHI